MWEKLTGRSGRPIWGQEWLYKPGSRDTDRNHQQGFLRTDQEVLQKSPEVFKDQNGKRSLTEEVSLADIFRAENCKEKEV